MLYCDECREKKIWPESLTMSIGICEICGNMRSCWNVKTSNLPKDKSTQQKDSNMLKIKVIDLTNNVLSLESSLCMTSILIYKKLPDGSYFIIKNRDGEQNYKMSSEKLIALLTSITNS